LLAKNESQQMKADGIMMRRSGSCGSSLLHIVRKSDKTLRPCRDHRQLSSSWTSRMVINKYLTKMVTSQRQQLSLHSVFGSFCTCPLVSATLGRVFRS
jgi:hypothetical protein